jgi:hypothetical protein
MAFLRSTNYNDTNPNNVKTKKTRRVSLKPSKGAVIVVETSVEIWIW